MFFLTAATTTVQSKRTLYQETTSRADVVAGSTPRELPIYRADLAQTKLRVLDLLNKNTTRLEATAIQRSAKKQKNTQGPGLLVLSLSCLLGVGPRRVEAAKLFLGLKFIFFETWLHFSFFFADP